MLKEILSISGKPGLFKLISQGKNMLIVESLIDQKRQPIHGHEKVISLADVAIFTETEEKPLHEVFSLIKEKESGKIASTDPKADGKKLNAFFAEVLPDFDKERVHTSDIKKVISWYNILINAGIGDFTPKEEPKEEVAS